MIPDPIYVLYTDIAVIMLCDKLRHVFLVFLRILKNVSGRNRLQVPQEIQIYFEVISLLEIQYLLASLY